MFKKILCFLMMTALCFGALNFKIYATEIGVSASAAILICADNGNVLYEKNSDKQLSMASTTKIMTAILGLEYAAANDKVVEFTSDMAAEGSSIYLKFGDKVKISELIKGLLAASGNDAANAIAKSSCGSIEKFVSEMNNRAKQIGMNSTSFVTPSGLDDDNHYSTARDMANLMVYAMENPEFAKIVAQKSVQVSFESPQGQVNTYNNHNKLLSTYEYCIGGKTGFTKKSGRCLVSCSEKDGVRLVAVTLNAPDDWNDHINMYNYGFKNLKKITMNDTEIGLELDVVGGETDKVMVNAQKSVDIIVRSEYQGNVEKNIFLPRFVYSTVKCGQEVGRVDYTINGELLQSVPLIATKEIKYIYKEKNLKNLWDRILEWLNVFK